MNIEQQNDLEGIRQLKARYFRLMDTHQWSEWPSCFTDDVFARYEGVPRASDDLPLDIEINGCADLVEGVKSLMTGAQSIHQGFMPEIELTGADTAKAIWSMFDYVMLPTCHFNGWGHYHEDYVKVNGAWRIKRIHLTRLHTQENFL